METRFQLEWKIYCCAELQWYKRAAHLRMTPARAKRILKLLHFIMYAVPYDRTTSISTFIADETLLAEQWLLTMGCLDDTDNMIINNIAEQLHGFHLLKNKQTDRALRRRFQQHGMQAMFQLQPQSNESVSNESGSIESGSVKSSNNESGSIKSGSVESCSGEEQHAMVCCVCMDAARVCNYSSQCGHDLSLCLACCGQLELCPVCRSL